MHFARIMAVGAALLSTLAVAQAGNVSLAAGDDDGVVVIGIVSGQSDAFRIRFARYAPQTGKVGGGYFGGRVTIEHQGAVDQVIYHVIPIDAGTHVFKSIHSTWSGRENVFCMGKGTYAFDVRPGEAIYLGDYSVFGGGLPRKSMDPALEELKREFPDSFIVVPSLTRLPDKFEAAKAALAEHPRVTVELRPGATRAATFESGRNSCG